MSDDNNIVQGIMPSEAATIVENAFRDILAFDDDQLAQLSPNDKFGKYCDEPRMTAIRSFVQTNAQGGLPSMAPPRTILNQAINDVGTGSAIRLLIQRLSDWAYYPVLVLISVIIVTSSAMAQFASYRRSDNRVEIALGQNISKATIKRIYVLTGTDTAKSYTAERVDSSGLTRDQITFTTDAGLIPTDLEASPVQVEILLVDEKGKSSYVTIPVKEVGAPANFQKMVEALKSTTKEAEDKDSAELYLSGTFTAAVGSKPNWIADAKYERQFFFDRFPFSVAPFVKLSYDSKPKETDSMSFGVKFLKGFGFSLPKSAPTDGIASLEYGVLTSAYAEQASKAELKRLRRTWSKRQYFDYSGTLQFESDWDFKVNNIITSQELKYLFRPMDSKNLQTRALFTPMIGAELGKNIKNPLNLGKPGIVRLKAGAELTIKKDKPFGTSRIKDLVWDSTLVERWFAKSEFAFDKDDDGKLIFKAFGRHPRPHFKSEVSFKFNDYFGPAFSYEWGEEPPLYKKVNHKATVKLVYSFSRKTAL